MMEAETATFNRLVPSRYYPTTIQVSNFRHLDLSALHLSQQHIRVSQEPDRKLDVAIVAESEQLPFGENSIDLLILVHALDFSSYPHDVLREVTQCVTPEGIVAISSFNPRSLFGVAKYMNRFSGTTVDQAHLYSAVRVRDWFALLGFEVIAGEYLFFRPPFVQQKRLNQFRSFETAGARWWPAMGSIYILVAKKKVLGVRMNAESLRKSRLSHRRLFQPIAEQTTK